MTPYRHSMRRRRWAHQGLLLILGVLCAMLGELGYSPLHLVYAAPMVRARLIIEHVEAIDKIDSNSSADFFARVTIGDHKFDDTRTENNNNSIDPNWTFEQNIDVSTTTQVPMIVAIWDKDGGINFKDNPVDITVDNGSALAFNVDLNTCLINGPISGSCRTSIMTSGTSSPRALMRMRVEIDGNAHFSGQVFNGSQPLGGHNVTVMNTVNNSVLGTATTTNNGFFTIDVLSPPNQPMRLEIQDCSNCQSLDPIVRGGGTPPISTSWRQAVFPGCAIGVLCVYAPIEFSFRVLFTDFEVKGWEVTQAIQSLDNDVPLVAHKPTYVRVYARQLQGPTVLEVEATLIGLRGTQPLPGSPLSPLYPVRSFVNHGFDRAIRDDGWLFQLPESWTNAGTIALQVQVNPRKEYTEQNQANNSLVGTFTFTQKAPICLRLIPVRTHAPTAEIRPSQSAALRSSLSWVKRLFPISDVWTYPDDTDIAEAGFGWPFWGFNPYELPENQGKIINSLWWRDQTSDDPDACDDAGARTHYVGVVHQDTSTGILLGSGRVGGDQLFFKLPLHNEEDPTNMKAEVAPTLAHELGHNYDREHVACGATEKLDTGYPYDPHWISNGKRDYGFDTITKQPLDPEQVSDLMSYCRPQWISDYTYKAVFNGINGTSTRGESSTSKDTEEPDVSRPSRAPAITAAQAELAQTQQVVLMTGIVTPTQNQGMLDYTFTLPSASVSSRMRLKWVSAAAPRTSKQTSPIKLGTDPTEHAYHVRLLATDGTVVDDRVVTPVEGTVHEASLNTIYTFAMAFPAATAAVSKIELLDQNTLLASLNPGTSAPVVDIQTPSGSETFDDHMTITWRAADQDSNDHLQYIVQYSPNNGNTWQTIVANVPHVSSGNTMSLVLQHLNSIPGSTTAGLIRVLASDGYHTTLALSQPFTVTNRRPDPYITIPANGQAFAADVPVSLSGGANDVETGGLDGDALQWTIDGRSVGTGVEQSIQGLAPGTYDVALTARDPAGQEQTIHHSITITPIVIPASGLPTLDGACDDAAYANAAVTRLAPHGDHTQARAQLVRTDTDLWICFSGMNRTADASGSFVGIHVDPNNSRDNFAQTNDYGFFTGQDGVAFTTSGDGQGGFSNAGPGGLESRTSSDGITWNAELRISSAQLGGWDHEMGLDIGEYQVAQPGDDYHWPYRAVANGPMTWARTILGNQPQITGISPDSVTVGGTAFQLTVHGTNFSDGMIVQWNGSPRPTTFVNPTELVAVIFTADLAHAGIANVSVANAAPSLIASNPISFTINNPTPSISSVSSPGATPQGLRLIVHGKDFVAGAKVVWNGITMPTTSEDSNTLQTTINTENLAGIHMADVLVVNPEPTASPSNSLPFTISYMTWLPQIDGAPGVLGVPSDVGPDLQGSLRLSPNKERFTSGEPVTVTAVITNTGEGVAPPFWIDLYINPSIPPNGPNSRWNEVCGLRPCYGIAWYVSGGLNPGQSMTVTSTIGSYVDGQTIWPGWFASGTTDLYLYVDSWNPGPPYGSVRERDESNNRAEIHGLHVTGKTPHASTRDVDDLVPR